MVYLENQLATTVYHRCDLIGIVKHRKKRRKKALTFYIELTIVIKQQSVSYETKGRDCVAGTLSKQKLELINQSFLFVDVDEIVVRRIIFGSECVRRKYARGAEISDADINDALGIVLSGALCLKRKSSNGAGIKLQTLRAGECFGATDVFSHKGNMMLSLFVESQAEVFYISGKTLRWAIERSNAIMENYIRYLSDTICMLQERLFALSAGPAVLRLAVFLSTQCTEDGTIICSMTDLSHQLNLGRASLYRSIEKLETKGLIQQNGKTIRLMSQAELQTFIHEYAYDYR